MNDATTLSGRCLCGSVSITVRVADLAVDACHCNMCRKWGGGPLLAVDCSELVQIDGEAHLTVFGSSEWAERGFCSQCGTHLFFRLKHQAHYAVPAGLFDGEQPWTFRQQIFIDEKPAFYEFSNKTRNMTGAEVFAEFGQ